MKNTVKVLGIIALAALLAFTFVSCPEPGAGIGGTGGIGNGGTSPIRPVDGVFTVANLAQWGDARTAIANGGNNKSYVINIKDSFSVPSSTGNTFGSVTAVNITINGDHALTLQSGTRGNLLHIGKNQTVIINDLNLNGHSNNNDSLVKVSGAFTMRGRASVTGNSNAGGNGGGVYIGGGSSFVMADDASVSGNNANKGGGLYINADSYVDILDGKVYGNDNYTLRNTAAAGASFYITDGSDAFYLDDSITMVSFIYQDPNAVTFVSLSANGSPEETTSQLTLTFDKQIPGLKAADIILSGISGANTITKSLNGSGPEYVLTIGNVGSSGTLTVTIVKPGADISPLSMSVGVVTAFVFNVANNTQWENARTAIANGGNDKNYTINITNNFNVPGSTAYTFGHVTGVNVTVNGNYILTLTGSGNILSISNRQTVIIQDLNLVGNNGNRYALVNIDGVFIMQNSAVVSGNSTEVGVSNSGINSTFEMYDNASISNNYYGVNIKYGTFKMYDNASVYNNDYDGIVLGDIFSHRNITFAMYNNTSVRNNKRYGVSVREGTFTMYDNSVISGNQTGVSVGNYGIPVREGTFTMYDNSVISSNQTGVSVGDVSAFRMAGGTIYGSNASATLRNDRTLSVSKDGGIATYGGYEGTANSFGGFDPSYPFANVKTTTITQTPSGSSNQDKRPVAPSNVRLVQSTGVTATISWDAVQNVTDYWVYRSRSASGSYSLVGITSSYETRFTDGPLSDGPSYYYRVSARNSFGTSDQSPSLYLSFAGRQISGIIATPLTTSNSIAVEWSDDFVNFAIIAGNNLANTFINYFTGLPFFANSSFSYIVERWDSSKNSWRGLSKYWIPTIPVIGTQIMYNRSFVDTGLSRNTTYRYGVSIEVKQNIFWGITIATWRTNTVTVSATTY
jgi:hypothetical protein